MIVIICVCLSFLPAGFVGATTAAVGDLPWVAEWQSGIICPAGQDLIADEHTVFTHSEPYSDTDAEGNRGHTGSEYSYRCSGDDSVVDRTGVVTLLNFLAGALVSYPVALAVLLIIALTMRRNANSRYANSFGTRNF